MLTRDPKIGNLDEATGDVELSRIPQTHGDHRHVSQFVVSAQEASGFSNPNVWTALKRKGLARGDNPLTMTLTSAGVAYDTGLGDRFLTKSDH